MLKESDYRESRSTDWPMLRMCSMHLSEAKAAKERPYNGKIKLKNGEVLFRGLNISITCNNFIELYGIISSQTLDRLSSLVSIVSTFVAPGLP